MLAYDLSDVVNAVGAEPVGPALDLQMGLQLAREDRLCGALLDVDLGGEMVWPLAEELERNKVPYAFVSAQCRTEKLPDPFKKRQCIEKPALREDIVAALVSFFD